MSLVQLYKDIKEKLTDECDLKHVALFNNQYERENVENPFLYPCAFIEFKPSTFKDLSVGVQQFDMVVTIHLGFESYTEDDLKVLELKQKIYVALQRLQSGYFALLSRVEERQNFDHGNTQVYEIDFRTTGKDYDADTRATKQVLVTPQVTAEIVKPDGL